MSSCSGTEAPGTVNIAIKLHLSKGAQGTNSPSCLLSHQNGSLLMCTYGSRQNKTSQCSLRSTRKAEIVAGALTTSSTSKVSWRWAPSQMTSVCPQPGCSCPAPMLGPQKLCPAEDTEGALGPLFHFHVRAKKPNPTHPETLP